MSEERWGVIEAWMSSKADLRMERGASYRHPKLWIFPDLILLYNGKLADKMAAASTSLCRPTRLGYQIRRAPPSAYVKHRTRASCASHSSIPIIFIRCTTPYHMLYPPSMLCWKRARGEHSSSRSGVDIFTSRYYASHQEGRPFRPNTLSVMPALLQL